MKKKKIEIPKFNIKYHKRKFKQHGNKLTYWLGLLVLFVTNLMVSIILIPFLLIMDKLPLYSVIILFGLAFGLLFDLIIHDIEDIEPHHHVATGLFMPAIIVLNLIIITGIANKGTEILQIQIRHNPLFISLLYAGAFILPFIVTKLRKVL